MATTKRKTTKKQMTEPPWTFRGEPFNDPGEFFGFVYQITNKQTGQRYLGRKNFFSLRKPAKGKRRVRKESDWRSYWSSSDKVKEDVLALGAENFERIILSLHTSKADLNYEETAVLFRFRVLEQSDYYNDNILGRYFRMSSNLFEGRLYANT